MKPGLNNFLWALAGAVILGLLLLLVFRFQSEWSPSGKLALTAREAELAAQIRLALASAAEAEKSAVLATTDKESTEFADQARAATATAGEKRTALADLLQARGTTKEKELLGQFSNAFFEFQRVDKELLDLAVKNTNIKAFALAFGPAAQAMKETDGALSRLVVESASSPSDSAKKEMLLAARAQAAALRIQVLLPPHIAEESDQKMDELEALMRKEDQEVTKDLKALATLLPGGNSDLEKATSSYSRFTELKTQILKFSRENTNVRSLSISLNEKRKVTVLCQDALAGLEKAIEEERIAGADDLPARPR
jgi:hypothetical protein